MQVYESMGGFTDQGELFVFLRELPASWTGPFGYWGTMDDRVWSLGSEGGAKGGGLLFSRRTEYEVNQAGRSVTRGGRTYRVWSRESVADVGSSRTIWYVVRHIGFGVHVRSRRYLVRSPAD